MCSPPVPARGCRISYRGIANPGLCSGIGSLWFSNREYRNAESTGQYLRRRRRRRGRRFVLVVIIIIAVAFTRRPLLLLLLQHRLESLPSVQSLVDGAGVVLELRRGSRIQTRMGSRVRAGGNSCAAGLNRYMREDDEKGAI